MSKQNLYIDFKDKDSCDESSFKLIYLEYYPGLIAFAKGFLKEKSLAEDIVDEIFLKLWNNRNTIYAIKNLKLYLYVSVKNACLNQIIKSQKYDCQSIDFLQSDIAEVTSNPEEIFITNEKLAIINQEVRRLPKKCQAIFILIKEEGLKYAEVAELLDLSIKTIETQMSIALKRLATAIKIQIPEAKNWIQRKNSSK